MDKEVVKSKREELKRAMVGAGFTVSSTIDKSIDLLLENLRVQKVEAGAEVRRTGQFLPGFLAVTQDYVFFSKRFDGGFFGKHDNLLKIKKPPTFVGETVYAAGLGMRPADTPNFIAMVMQQDFSKVATEGYRGHTSLNPFFNAAYEENLYTIARYCLNGRYPNDLIVKNEPQL